MTNISDRLLRVPHYEQRLKLANVSELLDFGWCIIRFKRKNDVTMLGYVHIDSRLVAQLAGNYDECSEELYDLRIKHNGKF